MRHEESLVAAKAGGGGGVVGQAGIVLRPVLAASRGSEQTVRSPGVL